MLSSPYSARKATGRITPITITAAGSEVLSVSPKRSGVIFSPSDGGAYSITTDGIAAFGIGYVIETTGGITDIYREFAGDLPSKAFFATSKAGTITAAVIEILDETEQ